MEGKTGINIVLTILAVLLFVLGIVLCVLCAVGLTFPGIEYPVENNLWIGLAAIGLSLLMLIGCNIATNVRIAADNSYDILRHVELLCKKEGISMADLARKDAEKAVKKAALVDKAKAKAEAATVAETPAKTEDPAEAPAPAAPVAVAAPVAEAPATDENLCISYEAWKEAVDSKTKCACGEAVRVRKTKSGLFVVACEGAVAKKGCGEKPLPVALLAEQFLAWYNEAYSDSVATFDIALYNAKVAEATLSAGTVRFTAK